MGYRKRRVKIVKVHRPTLWYAGHINDEFDVYDRGTDYVLTEDFDAGPDAMWRHIEHGDAVIAEETNGTPHQR